MAENLDSENNLVVTLNELNLDETSSEDTKSNKSRKRDPNYKLIHSKLEDIINKCNKAIEKSGKNGKSGVCLIRSIRDEAIQIQNINKKSFPKPKKVSISFSDEEFIKPKKINGFMNKLKISKELSEFLEVPEDSMFSRTEVTTALCVYVNRNLLESRESHTRWNYLNPNRTDENGVEVTERDLRDPVKKKIILPDEKLSKLLRYDDYVTRIESGEITKYEFDKEKNEYVRVLETDKNFYYKTLQQLIGFHFTK